MAIFPAKAKNITKETFFSLMYSNGATTHTYADLMRYCPFECLDLGEAMGIGSHLIAQYHGFMSVIDTSYNSGFINGTSIFAHTVIANTLQNKDPKYAGLTSKFTNLTQASPNYVAGGSTGEMILAAKKD